MVSRSDLARAGWYRATPFRTTTTFPRILSRAACFSFAQVEVSEGPRTTRSYSTSRTFAPPASALRLIRRLTNENSVLWFHSRFHLAVPSVREFVVNPDLVEQPRGRPVDNLVDGLRPRVKGGHRRADDRAHPRQFEHVLEVNVVERRLADGQHQLAALLQNDVGGA